MTETTVTETKTAFIRLGDFFFKYRNYLFPIMMALVFIAYAPSSPYNGNVLLAQKDMLAIAIVAMGLAVRAAVIGYAYIKRGGSNKKVFAETLVTSGFFAISRNPLYVGNMLIYIGVFLMHGNPYVVALGSAAMYGIYCAIIAAEEFFLRTHFGSTYADYCREVPRWLPRFNGTLSKLRHATKDMEFSFARVLIKDYTTIANAIFALCMIELLKAWQSDAATHGESTTTIGWIIAALIVFLTLVRIAKKRKWIRA